MTVIDKDSVKATLGAQQSVDGNIAGFGVFHELQGDVNLSSPTPTATFKINEASLARAEQTSGADKIASRTKTGSALTKAQSAQQKVDNQYSSLFRGSLQTDADRFVKSSQRSDRRPSYRHALSPQQNPAKSPLLRAKNMRRLLELRKTFDQIRARQTKQVQLNPENLPEIAKRKIVEQAMSTGAAFTPLGKLPDAMKKVGFNHQEWKRWEHALEGGFFAVPKPKGAA